jgi:hypothetical protein
VRRRPASSDTRRLVRSVKKHDVGKIYRREGGELVRDTVKFNVEKPVLRIGAYRRAMGDGFVEFPLRLEHDRTGVLLLGAGIRRRISLVAAGRM